MTEAALELALDPEAAARLFRHPAIAARPRAAAAEFGLHGGADGGLDEAGLAILVIHARGGLIQRLVRARPRPGDPWLPGAPMAVLGETALAEPHPDPAAFADLADLAGDRASKAEAAESLAAFSGRTLRATAGERGPRVTLLAGTLHAIAAERTVARVTLTGEAGQVFTLAEALAADLPLGVPATSLAEEARALARGEAARPLREGAPTIPPGATTAEAFSAIVSHLTLAILANAPAALAGETEEGVHQMRVALRRLRSALSLFRAVAGQEGKEAATALKGLARRLGPARDWDVFLGERLGPVALAFAGDAAIAALRDEAAAAREAAYASLREELEGPRFRHLGLALARLAAQPGEAPEPVATFAAAALAKRFKRVTRHGEDLSGLAVAELHELRIHCKRLRYAGEMFAALFAPKKARRFLKALTAVQERLGHLNDAAVGASLLGQLEAPGEGRAFAAGAVEGWIAAKAEHTREGAFAAWEKFLDRGPFWRA